MIISDYNLNSIDHIMLTYLGINVKAPETRESILDIIVDTLDNINKPVDSIDIRNILDENEMVNDKSRYLNVLTASDDYWVKVSSKLQSIGRQAGRP